MIYAKPQRYPRFVKTYNRINDNYENDYYIDK